MTIRLYFLLLKTFLACFLGVVIASSAMATGGYPYAHFDGPGTSPKASIWTDPQGNRFSSYGYAYRNCTDFVAWKTVSLGAAAQKLKGLGNGGQWAERARAKGLEVSASPRMWSVAVSSAGIYGHVAFVEEVLNGGVIKVSEYNFASPGVYGVRKGTPAQLSISAFVLVGINPPPAIPTSTSPPPQVVALKKTQAADGVHLLYSALPDAVYESWWRPGQGVHDSQIISVPGIVAIDTQELSNGVHLLYTAVRDGVYETWWRPGESVHHAKIVSLPGVRRVIAEQQPDGTHSLYVLAQDGPYEFWWRDGGPIHSSRLAHIVDPVAMVKAYGSNGQHQIVTATAGAVFETVWVPSGPVQTRQLIGIAQTDIMDVAKQTLSDGTELLYTAVSTGVWESWWQAGTQPSHSKIVGTPGVTRIEKQIASDGTHLLYVAAASEVKEYCWRPGLSLQGVRLVAANGIVDIEKSQIGPDHLLYTAAGPNIYETWWQAGGALKTTELGSFD